MAKQIDFISGLPDGVVTDGTLQGGNLILTPGQYLEVTDGNISASGSYDIEVVASLDTAGNDGKFSVTANYGGDIELLYGVKLTQYSAITAYVGANAQTSLITNVNAPGNTFHKVKMEYALNGYIQCSINDTKVSSGTKTDPQIRVNTGNIRIENTSPVDLTLQSVAGIEYITGISNQTPKLGEVISISGTDFGLDATGSTLTLTNKAILDDIIGDIVNWTPNTLWLNIATDVMPYNRNVSVTLDTPLGFWLNTIQIKPDDTEEVVNLLDPFKNNSNYGSILDNYTGDEPLNEFQVVYDKVNNLLVNANGTCEYSGNLSTVVVNAKVRSEVDGVWGSYGATTLNLVDNVSNNLSVIGSPVIRADGADVIINTSNNTGNIYYIATKLLQKPSRAQLDIGYNFDDELATVHGDINVTSAGNININISGLSEGKYAIYAYHKIDNTTFTNTIVEVIDVLGLPVTPVITQQPASGSVQETQDTSIHNLTLVASPLSKIQWEINKNSAGWEVNPDETASTYKVDGNSFSQDDSPIQVRALLTGEGGATIYTDEVTLTVLPAPSVTINVTGMPDGDAFLRIWEEDNGSGGNKIYQGTVSILNETATTTVAYPTGVNFVGMLWYMDSTLSEYVGTGVNGSVD